MGEWNSARTTLELVLAHDPSRAPALEVLIEAYEKLDLPRPRRRPAGACPASRSSRPAARRRCTGRRRSCERSSTIRTPRSTPTFGRRTSIRDFSLPACAWSTTSGAPAIWTSSRIWPTTSGTCPSPWTPARISSCASASPGRTCASTSRPARPSPRHPALAIAAARALADAAGRQQELETRGVDALDPLVSRARAWAGGGRARPRARPHRSGVRGPDPTRPGGRARTLRGDRGPARAGGRRLRPPRLHLARRLGGAATRRARPPRPGPRRGGPDRRPGRPSRLRRARAARARPPRARAARLRDRATRAQADRGERPAARARRRAAAHRRSARTPPRSSSRPTSSRPTPPTIAGGCASS